MSSDTPALTAALAKLSRREDLSAAEAESAFTEIMEGLGDDIQKSALLMGLRAKGETPAEVAGGVRALRRVVIKVESAGPAKAKLKRSQVSISGSHPRRRRVPSYSR